MKHLADLLFFFGLALASFGISYEFTPYIAAIFAGNLLIICGFFAALKAKSE